MGGIFVSSTYRDLADYRDRVERVVLKYGALVRGMEFFGDPSRPTLDACYSEIDQCELVICIIGVSYGTRPAQDRPSYTAHEIQYAKRKGIPIAPFFLNEDSPAIFRSREVARGKDHDDLLLLKQELGPPHLTPAYFVNPEDLGEQVSTYLGRRYKDMTENYRKEEEAKRAYRECNYDIIAEWYDHWYQDHWRSADAFRAIEEIGIYEYPDIFHGSPPRIRVLDCACGTGNSFVAFQEAGYDCIGTDGSLRMLEKAMKNCDANNIDRRNIIERAVNWKDLESYQKILLARSSPSTNYFDIIINTNNSFCHIPPTKEYMGLALQNFWSLLKPGGLVIIDTKRFIRDTPVEDETGKPKAKAIYKELRYVTGEWHLRTEREETRTIPEKGGLISFHTSLHYDIDRSFGPDVNRALIVLTVYGSAIHPQTFVIPYYPLPAHVLAAFMKDAGFTPRIFPASENPTAKYRYDIVIGRKNDLRHEHQ